MTPARLQPDWNYAYEERLGLLGYRRDVLNPPKPDGPAVALAAAAADEYVAWLAARQREAGWSCP